MPSEPSMLQVVLMGLITVFIVLICIIFIIKLMSKVVNSGKKEDSAPVQPVAAPVAAPAPAPAGNVNNNQLVAAISVAIAESMGTDVSHLRIHSIKKR